MATIVLLNISGSLVRVECDGIARDNLLSGNVVLAGCRELDTEARNGDTLDTRVWSVPESAIISYAVGKLPVKEEPALIELAQVDPAPVPVLTDEQKEARRARYDRMDDAIRNGRAKKPAKKKPAVKKT